MDVSAKFGLPCVSKARLRSEIDFYGLSSIIAKQLGLASIPRSFATWRHGWIFVPLKYEAQIIWMHHDAPFHLVATEKEAAFLTGQGFNNVVAAGLPFIYADFYNIERLPNSLLVMPPHTLEHTQHDMAVTNYIEYIKSISNKFSTVVFCLHQACIEKGIWCSSLEKAGIGWVVGASAHDVNSLLRMQKLFRSFEYMTSCTMGSHLVYGAYCGCKVSVAGSFFEYKKETFKNDPYFLRYPEVLSHNLEYSSKAALKSRYPFLFVEPTEATPLVEWANEEAGASNKKSVEELKKYLGWDLHGQARLCFHLLKRAPKKLTDIPGLLSRRFAIRDSR